MGIHKRRMTMEVFIVSEFGNCPLVRMFHSEKLNSRINKLHEGALRIMYQDYTCSFTELLAKDNSIIIHIRNIRLLPSCISKILAENAQYYKLNSVKTVYNRTETFLTGSFLVPRICEILPDYIK